MSMPLSAEVRTFLDELEAVQRDLGVLFQAKHAALVSARVDEINRLLKPESDLTARLQALLKRRAGILERSRLAGRPAETLSQLIPTLADGQADAAQLAQRAADAGQAAQDLRRDSWIQWIIAQRAYGHFSAVLELIAQCGQASPTYGPACRTVSPGGAILDASA